MKERDAVAAQAAPRGLVDEVDAGGAKLVERVSHVRNLEGDVMDSLPASLEEPPDGVVGVERLDELDVPPADAEGRRLDALVGENLPDLQGHPELLGVEGERSVDVADDVGHVVDLLEAHG